MKPLSHAVVVGGSMAGLLAARVLSDHCERVTVVERDRFPAGPLPRKGVPQARHAHVLLASGHRLLARLFPGIDSELAADGAVHVNWTADTYWINFAGRKPRFYSHLCSAICSRDLLEWHVRQRLSQIPAVTFVQEADVVGLAANASKTTVTGVRIAYRAQQDGDVRSTEVLPADLVVDASGRSSRAPEWLQELGYAAPRETVINAFLGYASRYYRRPPGFNAEWTVLNIQPSPPGTRGGVILPLEDDRWLVTLAGVGRDYPPTDAQGFLEYARTLQDPTLYEAISAAEPLSPIHGYRRTENRLRHYERLSRLPERFVVTGDAACAFNPVYGQGMTVAAMGALALDRTLREHLYGRNGEDLTGMSRRFQRRLAGVTSVPWLLATGEDFRVPATEGGHPGVVTRLMHRYMDGVMVLMSTDVDVCLVFAEVLHLLRPPRALFRPSIAARVLWQTAARRRGQGRLPGDEGARRRGFEALGESSIAAVDGAVADGNG